MDSMHTVESSPQVHPKKSKKHSRVDSSRTDEHTDLKSEAIAAVLGPIASTARSTERRKVKKSKREASDRSKRSSGDSGAESETSVGEGTSSPKEKKGDKRKLKKSESGEKRRLKTRRSSKSKEKDNNGAGSAAASSSHTRLESSASAPRGDYGANLDEAEEQQESLAFDSSDEVTPIVDPNVESDEEGSLATSTTNIRTLGRMDYTASRRSSSARASYHSQITEGGNGAMGTGLSPMSPDSSGTNMMTGLSQTMRQRSRSGIHNREQRGTNHMEAQQGSDESDDGEVTWRSSTVNTAATAAARKRLSTGFYDGFSSAQSSDSESTVRRRSYLKPRPMTERRPDRDSMGSLSGGGSSSAITPGPSNSASAFRAASLDDRIKINVGGRVFETYVSTLRKYPHTLLGTMLHPRNAHLLGGKVGPDGKPNPDTELFFDRNPRMFEVILDFYRTSNVHRPPDVSWEMLQEELSFFQIDLPEYTTLSKRVSVELRKLEYKDLILPASEYRKMTRVKLLKEHHTSIVRILDFIQRKIQKKADAGHNTSTITFYSPLHYTNSTPREIFKVISTNEIRELLVELLRSKDFQVKETNEYSKTKTTSIIGLHDQIINYNDPQYFSFHIKW